MSDLISRQAAIDALNKMKIYRPLDSDRYVISDCLNKIVNLPSAQPEKRTEKRTETHACDLIDRQAAIDILDAYQVMVENGEENPYAWARLRMSELPSVQPDLSEYSDKLWHNAYERGKTEAEIQKMQDLEQAEIQKAYELGKLDAMEEMPHWILCSERLPRTNGVYNVTRKISDGFECRNISDACYFDGINMWHDDTRVNHGRRYLTDVIAWMPLPEPYRGEKNENRR